MYTSLLISTLIILFNISKVPFPLAKNLTLFVQIVRFENRILSQAFFKTLKITLFSNFPWETPYEIQNRTLKNTHSSDPISSMCTHHLTLRVVFPKSQH